MNWRLYKIVQVLNTKKGKTANQIAEETGFSSHEVSHTIKWRDLNSLVEIDKSEIHFKYKLSQKLIFFPKGHKYRVKVAT